MKPRIPTIEDYGIVASHDQACSVYYETESAIYDCNSGVFHPSWNAQNEGWRLIKIENGFQKFILKRLGLIYR